MSVTTWNAYGLTGGTVDDLDAIATVNLADKDRAFVADSGAFYYYQFDATSTATTNSPNTIRPADYTTAGVWIFIPSITDVSGTGKNLFMNSAYKVNQEGYASGVITTGEYGHDMLKSISSASYTVTAKALTIVSGTLGQRNDDLEDWHGESVTVSVVSGSLTLGATGGAAVTIVTAINPYTFTLDMDLVTDFVTFTAAAAAKGIKIEPGTTATLYVEPEPRSEEERCYYRYQRIYGSSYSSADVVGYGRAEELMVPLKYKIKTGATLYLSGTCNIFYGTSTPRTNSDILGYVFNDVGVVIVFSVGGISGVSIMEMSSTSYLEIDARP